MKQRLLKIKNKKIKGNVSLLIILVLLASSVIALLSINQIQHLLTYWNTTFNYFRSFYLAKAWTELGLTEVYNRGNGFENTIESWDKIITENLVWLYTWFNPYFDMQIESNFKYLTNDIRYTNKCDNDNEIVLGAWSWIVLPLFKDITGESGINKTKKILDEAWNYERYNNIRDLDIITQWGYDFTFWFFVFDEIDGQMKDVVVKPWSSLKKFLSEYASQLVGDTSIYKYLTIKNSWTSEARLCIVWNWNIPYSNSLISVRANYWDVEVGLQSIVKKDIPYWSLNVLGDKED